MKRLSLSLTLLTLTFMSALVPTQQAQALPFLDVGPKLGYGVGILSGDNTEDIDSNTTITAFGVAGSFDVVMLQLEVNVLYLKAAYEQNINILGTKTTAKSEADFLAIPIIGRFDISPIPMVKLALGGGYERRFYLGDGDSPELNYMPLSVRADLKVPMIGAVGIEGRFNYQLGDDDIKNNELMVFLHAFL